MAGVFRQKPYVRDDDERMWHWCANCSRYPRYFAAIRSERPSNDLLSPECREKELHGYCHI